MHLVPASLWVLLIPALFAGMVLRARRQPLWSEAFRRLRRSGRALAAIVVISLYCTVGLLDTIAFARGPGTAEKTVIDLIFERPQERYYSAPLATETVGEATPHPLNERHLLGTDSIGNDVLYMTMKGVRTALIIGGLTSLIATPLALLFGLCAGYFGRRVDDAIQYVYTVLDSIPGILLLISLMVVMGRGLPQMCLALGITSWVGLCRLARGEALKHRDREYVRAARALGLGHGRILYRHILPNMLPLVIINVTLGFSGLVLQEAILSYLQIGVAPGTGSWGNMIDAARLELAREPIVWWNLTSASAALFILVLAMNFLGDALRDAIDPRLRTA